MKKRPGTFWRWLLALLLGAGTWCGVGWWLLPRPHWEAVYETNKFAVPIKTPEDKDKPPEEQIEELGKRFRTQLNATILDHQGRYLLIDQTHAAGPYQYEIIDLPARQRVARHAINDPGLLARSLNGYKHICARDNLVFLSITQPIVENKPFLQHDNLHTQLWQWEVLIKETRLIKKYPQGTMLEFSKDGSTLLEMERVSVMQPSLLLPQTIPNLLAAHLESHLRYSDLAVYRVWSLPSLTLRCTLTLPWIFRQNGASLTADGRYLFLADVDLPEDMTSAHPFQKERHEMINELIQEKHRPYYLTNPTGCFVYDSTTGQLVSEYHADKAAYIGVYSDHPDFTFALQGEDHPTNQKQDLILHLPTMTWKLGLARNVASFDHSHVHTAEYINGVNPHVDIQLISKYGTACHAGTVKTDGFIRLLPHATQFLSEYTSRRSDALPRWLVDWLGAKALLPSWLSENWQHLEINDYAKNRTLLSLRSRSMMDSSTTDRWLVVTDDDFERFHVSVYALPFASWAPWWSLTAGILVFLLACYLLRQRQPRRG